jgi:protease-4
MEPSSYPTPPEQPADAIVTRPPPAYRPRRRSVLTPLLAILLVGSVLLNLLLLMAVAGSLESNDYIEEKYLFADEYRDGTRKVAVMNLSGVITDGDQFVKRQIEQVRRDEAVKAVVLRIDSPGGTITGSDYIYHHLKEMTEEKGIPLVVSMGGLAASGGYYAAMAVGHAPDVIFAEPTTWTGSIGVIIPNYSLVELMEKVGVEETSIASHRLKNMGSLTKPMTEEERKIFQELVDESFGRFKDIIKSGRAKFDQDPAALDKLATGQIFTAQQAKSNGLVDRIGFIEEAVDRAIELAKLDKDDVKVVEYEQPLTLSSLLFGSGTTGSRGASLDTAALLDLSTPRAYYLFTRLPPLLRSGL